MQVRPRPRRGERGPDLLKIDLLAEDLPDLNENIVGAIEVVSEFPDKD